MIIGLTGSMGSGKGEIVKILEEHGFSYITLSSMVREEAKKRGIEEEREKLMEIGNSMRKEHGAGVLAKMALEKIKNSNKEKWVIDGIRNPSEIDELKKQDNVYIIGLFADREILINRIINRNRTSDSKAREEIIFKIERELGKDEKQDGQQVAKCMERIDKLIINEGTLDELKKEFKNIMKL
jgi:dephospho-CoA kinase